jgi:prolipoprotein diacylglyceryltransferase
MSNVLVQLNGLNVYFYGTSLVFVFLASLFFFWRELKTTSLDEEKTVDQLITSLLISFLVARIAYVIAKLPFFLSYPWKIVFFYVFPGQSDFFFWLTFISYWLSVSRKEKTDLRIFIQLVLFLA